MIINMDNIIKYRHDIISLWHDSFGDDNEYIEFFLDNCAEYTFVADIEKKSIISMLFLLNGMVCNDKCYYLYAACTDKKYRQQGRMGKLIDYCKELSVKNDISGIFLVPANDKLYDYYSRFGFVSCFLKNGFSINIDENKYNKSTADEYNGDILRLRHDLLKGINCFEFTKPDNEYSLKEHIFSKGNYIAFNDENEKSLAFYYIKEKKVVIKELLSNSFSDTNIFYALFKKYNIENIYIQCPIVYNSKDSNVVSIKCGMLFPASPLLKAKIADGNIFYAGMFLD